MSDITYLTAEIVASAAANEASRMQTKDLVDLIRSVRSALSEETAGPAPDTAAKAAPMSKAQWSKLITPGKIKSLIDGKSYSTMKRHLTRHGHDPKSYREAFGLPSDFPMVSPDYSAARSAMARQLGLGARGGKATPAPEPTPPAKQARGRKPKA